MMGRRVEAPRAELLVGDPQERLVPFREAAVVADQRAQADALVPHHPPDPRASSSTSSKPHDTTSPSCVEPRS